MGSRIWLTHFFAPSLLRAKGLVLLEIFLRYSEIFLFIDRAVIYKTLSNQIYEHMASISIRNRQNRRTESTNGPKGLVRLFSPNLPPFNRNSDSTLLSHNSRHWQSRIANYYTNIQNEQLMHYSHRKTRMVHDARCTTRSSFSFRSVESLLGSSFFVSRDS